MGKRKVSTAFILMDTPIHNLHPLTKLSAVACTIVTTFSMPGPIYPLLLFFLWAAASYVGRVHRVLLAFMGKVMFPIAAAIFLLHGLVNPRNLVPLVAFGPVVFYVEGSYFAATIICRLLAMCSSFLILTVSTHPGHMAAALMEKGMSQKAGYLMIATLQILPQMQRKAAIIRSAQQARGLETEGSLIRRFKAFIPLITPLVLSTLSDLEERGMTLQTRAFGAVSNPTHPFDLVDTPGQRMYRKMQTIGAVLLVVGAIVWRIAGWL